MNAIKDQTWTIKFNKNGGLFILGEEPHKYEDITLDKRYQRKNYFITESLSSVEYHNPISIKVQDVYLINNKNKNKKEEITINEDKGCYLNYNNGFITATKEYWDYIKKNFFNKFLVSNICKEEVIKFIELSSLIVYIGKPNVFSNSCSFPSYSKIKSYKTSSIDLFEASVAITSSKYNENLS